MKQATIKLYKYNELSKDVKQSLINEVRWTLMDRVMDSAKGERKKSLEQFCDIFCVDLKKYECDYNGYYFNFKIDKDDLRDAFHYLDADEVSGKYLRRFLNNEWIYKYIINGKYYGKFTKDDRLVQRYSKVIFDRHCVFTGSCYDDDLMDFVWEVYDKPIKDNFTLHDLVSMCLTRFFESWHKEYEYWGDTDSAIDEELNNYYENDYFFANGVKFNGVIEKEIA